jgi:CRISPR-associated protein Cmr5
MKNLDQLRAAHALETITHNEKLDRSAVAKLPAMILNNGLLGTLAFANEGKDSRSHLSKAAHSLAAYLSKPEIGLPGLRAGSSTKELAEALAKGDAINLQRATAEALAYLSYLKRYATA